jgi:hypothetical protein
VVEAPLAAGPMRPRPTHGEPAPPRAHHRSGSGSGSGSSGGSSAGRQRLVHGRHAGARRDQESSEDSLDTPGRAAHRLRRSAAADSLEPGYSSV